jgi:hypothetical protein
MILLRVGQCGVISPLGRIIAGLRVTPASPFGSSREAVALDFDRLADRLGHRRCESGEHKPWQRFRQESSVGQQCRIAYTIRRVF